MLGRSRVILLGILLSEEKKMPEHSEHTADKILNSLVETFADSLPKQKSVRFFDEGNKGSAEISAQMNRLFGRQKSVHKILGGGQSADVLLWRNKKISAGVLTSATVIWALFEWLDYHFFSLVCFALVIGMVVQFVWSNASGFLNKSSSEVPRLVLPDELFVNFAVSIGAQVNQFLGFIQDVACGRNLKQFAMDRVGANDASDKSPPSRGQSSNIGTLQRKSVNPKSTMMSSVDGTSEQKCEVLDRRRNIIAIGRVHNDSNQTTSYGIPFNKKEEVVIVDVIYNGETELYAPNSFADVLNDVGVGGFMK